MQTQRKLLWALGIIVLLGSICAGWYWFDMNRVPDLDRPFTPAERYPESIRQESINRVNAAIAELRENPELVSRWLEVAVYRKGADDYEGAEEIWRYMTRKWPEDATAYGNLANLYQDELNKPEKAARYWKKYLKVAPQGYDVAGYRALHDLYRTKLADRESAKNILLEGLAKYPENTDLLIPLAVFERDGGSKEEAVNYFTEAKKVADSTNNAALSAILAEELQKLGE